MRSISILLSFMKLINLRYFYNQRGCALLKQNHDYLLNAAEPWVVYGTMRDLMELKENDPKVLKAKKQLLKHPLIQGLLEELHNWPGTVIASHKSAGQLYHKLEFLADMGLTTDDDDLSLIEKDQGAPFRGRPFSITDEYSGALRRHR